MSVGVLSQVFTAEVVDTVIMQCGRAEQRCRLLPARSMGFFAMRVALHAEGSYEDVLALISEGLGWAHNDERSGRLANKAAILHARDRLGPEPMALLFEGGPKPLAAQDAPGCRLAGRRLVAIDGACLDLPDTLANDTHLGAPVGQCGIHAMFDAVIGPYTTSENVARSQLLGRLEPGML